MGIHALPRLVTLGIAGLLAGCGGAPDPVAGDYEAAGAGAAVPQLQALTAEFTRQHPAARWTVTNAGSDAGVKLVLSGDVNLGFVSRYLRPEEADQLGVVPLGITGTAIVVNAANPVRSLAVDQLAAIFSGDIDRWSGVGGTSAKIRVFIREAGSATRAAFEESVLHGNFTYAKGAIEVYKPEATLEAIRQFPDGIGMVTFTSRKIEDPQFKLLSIGGVAPTRESLGNSTYPLRRPLFLVYDPSASRRSAGVRAFLDFVRSDAGQRILSAF